MDQLTIQQRAKAACRGCDTDLWYPQRGDDGAEARAVCAGCPVREPCLIAAIASGEMHGIHGAAGESARRPLRRAWRVGGPAWTAALAEHWDRIDDPGHASPIRSLGDGATHGRRVSHARGCRCDPCLIAPALGDAWLARIPVRPARIPTQPATAA